MTHKTNYGQCRDGLQMAIEILRGSSQLEPGDKVREAIAVKIEDVMRITEDRTIALQMMLGFQQDKTWASLETINRARETLGWQAWDGATKRSS